MSSHASFDAQFQSPQMASTGSMGSSTPHSQKAPSLQQIDTTYSHNHTHADSTHGQASSNMSSHPTSAQQSSHNTPIEASQNQDAISLPPRSFSHQRQTSQPQNIVRPQPVVPVASSASDPQSLDLTPSGHQIGMSIPPAVVQNQVQQVWQAFPDQNLGQVPTSKQNGQQQAQQQALSSTALPHSASAPPNLPLGAVASSMPGSSTGSSSAATPSVYSSALPQPSASPLLTLSQLNQMATAHENAGPPGISVGQAHSRKPSQTDRRPQLRAITTALPPQTASTESPHSAAQSSSKPPNGLQLSFALPPPNDGVTKEAAAIQRIGVILDDIATSALKARDLFRKGEHGPSSMCLTEMSRMIGKIGELGSQSLAEQQESNQQSQQQASNQPTHGQPSSMQAPAIPAKPSAGYSSRTTSPQQYRQGNMSEAHDESEFINPVLESPGIRKRGVNPYDELPMKTMRGQHGTPIEPPAAPPSAPPAIHQDSPHTQNGSNTSASLLHTGSAPLVPQMKAFGPSPLNSAQMQAHGWHDPGSGAVSGPTPSSTTMSPVVAQSEESFGRGHGLMTQPITAHSTRPPSPQAKIHHARNHSLLDEVFSQKTALNANGGLPTLTYSNDDDSGWIGESGAQSPVDVWSPSHDADDPLAQAGGHVDPSSAAHGQSLKGSIDAPDMPGRGPILPLPPSIQERLDGLFYQYLRFVCSHNDCADANGEGIHQTLMPKRMSRLNHSEDFRPFKFRIQAFVNRWQEEVYKNGLTEEQCSHKRLRQYLWTQPYISRFNEDGRKAKSKGNHVWIVEGRKLSDDQWEFQRFERKIVGPAERLATRGMTWSWILRVWDPQMSAASIKPTFSVISKPSWLEFNDSEEHAEKSLSGVPNDDSEGGKVAVSAQCLHSNGSLQHLEISFDLEIGPRDGDANLPHGGSNGSRSRAATMAPFPNLQDVAGHPAVQPLGFIQAAGTPAAGNLTFSSMQNPDLVPRLYSNEGALNMPPPLQSGPPVVQTQSSGTPQNADQFFASANYPFTPPDAFTSQGPFFMPDSHNDSPMPMAMPLGENTFPADQYQQQQQRQQQQPLEPPQPQQQQQQASSQHAQQPSAAAPAQKGSFPQINSAPVLATPVQKSSLEPHDQIQRAQIRAMIDRMQRDQTASLSLQLPERRKSQSVRHEQTQVDQQHNQRLVEQRQFANLPSSRGSQTADDVVDDHQSRSSTMNDPTSSPFGASLTMPSNGMTGSDGLTMQIANASGLSQASLDPVLSPALEMNPFASLSSFHSPQQQQQTNQQQQQQQQEDANAGVSNTIDDMNGGGS
ncbi:unnamed protein product [Sympodiomycopsis kandeliae]